MGDKVNAMQGAVPIDEVSRPAMRLPFVNTPTLYLQDRRLLACVNVNYSDAAHGAALFLVDIDAMADRKIRLPGGEVGAYAFVRGADGNLYMGTFDGVIYRYDFEGDDIVEVARPFAGRRGAWFWGGIAATSGKVYMGVYPTGEFCEYDIAGGSFNIVAPMPAEGCGYYAREFVELPDGTILIYVGGSRPTILLYDPATTTSRDIMTLTPEHAGFGYFEGFLDDSRVILKISERHEGRLRIFNWRNMRFEGDFLKELKDVLHLTRAGHDVYATTYPAGRVYRQRKDKLDVVVDGFPDGNRLDRIHHVVAEEFVGLGDNGLFVRFDLKTGESSSFQVGNESKRGTRISFLETIPDRNVVIGSHFICMQMFKIDLESGASESSLNKISQYTGQVTCGTAVGDTFYLASYGKAVLYALDPEAPFEYGTNPRLIGEIGEVQNRPVEMVNDGRYVYVATKAEYGSLGGAITVLDPATERFEVCRNFVPDQNPTSLFYCPSTECLVGTTETCGDCDTHQATAEAAVVFIWDTRQRKTIHTSSPWTSGLLRARSLSGDGTLIGFDPDRYFVFDLHRREYEVRPWSHKPVTAGIFMDDGCFYGATEDRLFRLDVGADDVLLLAHTSRTTLFERVSENRMLFTRDEGVVQEMATTGS